MTITEVEQKRTLASRFWELLAWLIVPMLVSMIAMASVALAYALTILALGFAVGVFVRRLNFQWLGIARACGLVWAALILFSGGVGEQTMRAERARIDSELATLRDSDPQAYLDQILEQSGDAAWLAALQSVDESEYAAEVERRRVAVEVQAQGDIERADRERQTQRAADEVRRESERRAPTQNYLAALGRAESELEQPARMPRTAGDVGDFLGRIARYSELVAEGRRLSLSDADEARRVAFVPRLVDFQRREFPRVRDALGPAMRRDLWIDNASARTIGTGYRIMEITSARYVLNRHIQTDFEMIGSTLRMLRFERVTFRQYEGGPGTTYNLAPLAPHDDEIVAWRNGYSVPIQ